MERYTGVRFKTLFISSAFSSPRKADVIRAIRHLATLGVLSGNAGNISIRTRRESSVQSNTPRSSNSGALYTKKKTSPWGIIITPAGHDMIQITEGDLVYVSEADENTNMVIASGRNIPSSETFLHWFIYSEYPSIDAIVHIHLDAALENPLDLPVTQKEYPYGTIELAREALKALGSRPFKNPAIILKNHGLVVVGKTLQNCLDTIDAIITRF